MTNSRLNIIKEKVETFHKVLNEIPEVVYVGDPVLRTKCVSTTPSEGKAIGEKLGEILLRYRHIAGIGRGLAAPQIGINKSVFVTYVNDQLQTFINPVIIERSPTTNFYKELCLSSGVMAVDVERAEWIVMDWDTLDGVHHKEKIEGFLARLYQHEEAHLRGVVNLDEASPKGIEMLCFDPLKETLRSSR
jgi:peptide deformylase